MKRLLLILLIMLSAFAVNTLQALENKKEVKAEKVSLKNLNGNDVNAMAKSNFTTDFGNIAEVKWHRADYFDEARFIKNGALMTAYYDFDGKLVGSTQAKTFSDLPAGAQSEIKKKYKDYSIGPVIFFDDSELNATDMVLYGRQFDDQDNYFVELTKGTHKIVLMVDMRGFVSYFKDLH